MSEALDGRTALVTGATQGIGHAIVRALLGDGARVLCLGRNRARLAQLATESGGRAEAVPCDLLRPDEVARVIADVAARCEGAPDAIIQNAGLFVLGNVESLGTDLFTRSLDVNLVAPYRLAHAFVPAMRARASGHIVTIGSVADRVAYPGNAAYAASKFGVRAVHEVLREELRGSGVRTTLVSPGPVDTAMWDPVDPDNRPGFTPRARMLSPEAVADAVRWVLTRPPAVNIDELRLSSS